MFLKRGILGFAFAVWLCSATAGMAVLWTYEAQPGLAADPPRQWPDDSTLQVDAGKQAMLVWIHPRCPCSRATVSELERLLVHLPDVIDCQVVIAQPTEADSDFHETPLTQAVRRLPEVKVIIDDGLVETKRFGVATSGQVLLYGHHSQLIFAGGVTGSRGHEGDNRGTTALREIFREQQPPLCCRGNAVFGCELFANGLQKEKSK